MEYFRRQFDQRTTVQTNRQVLSGLSSQILLLAIGCVNLGMFVILMTTEGKRGDPNGVVVYFRIAVASSFAMVLTCGFGIRRSIRRLLLEAPPAQ
ncbi:MAG: hypothetical protein ABR956_18605 [Terracidiphilus sp.]|jgi:hypothetical protein